jgi:hypothetical protein
MMAGINAMIHAVWEIRIQILPRALKFRILIWFCHNIIKNQIMLTSSPQTHKWVCIAPECVIMNSYRAYDVIFENHCTASQIFSFTGYSLDFR